MSVFVPVQLQALTQPTFREGAQVLVKKGWIVSECRCSFSSSAQNGKRLFNRFQRGHSMFFFLCEQSPLGWHTDAQKKPGYASVTQSSPTQGSMGCRIQHQTECLVFTSVLSMITCWILHEKIQLKYFLRVKDEEMFHEAGLIKLALVGTKNCTWSSQSIYQIWSVMLLEDTETCKEVTAECMWSF